MRSGFEKQPACNRKPVAARGTRKDEVIHAPRVITEPPVARGERRSKTGSRPHDNSAKRRAEAAAARAHSVGERYRRHVAGVKSRAGSSCRLGCQVPLLLARGVSPWLWWGSAGGVDA